MVQVSAPHQNLTRFLRTHMFGPGRHSSPHTSLACSAHTCLVQLGAPHLNLTRFLRAHMFGPGRRTSSKPHSLPPGAHVWSRQAQLITHLTRFLTAHMFGPGRRSSSQTSIASSMPTCLVQLGTPHYTTHSLHPGAHVWSR